VLRGRAIVPRCGSGARSFAPRGRGPLGIGPSVLDPGEVTTAFAGGGAFAASPLQGTALAGGARPIATMNPNAVADAVDSDRIRGIADMSPLSGSGTAALTSAVSSCDDSDQWGLCDQ
jgi:hypothetical protein